MLAHHRLPLNDSSVVDNEGSGIGMHESGKKK